MPKRSLNSSVFRWPAADKVKAAARAWAQDIASRNESVRWIVCFGPLADGRWGVGSDLDLFIEVFESNIPFIKRSADFDTSTLPVSADVIVHTSQEVERMRKESRRFVREIDEKGLQFWPDPA